jgi:dTMP kinase
MSTGLLITIEGIDGSGKTTLIENIAKQLQAQKIPLLTTKEPGGTQLGQQLRTILQTQPVAVCPKAEFLMFAADRAQHFEQLIMPALAQGTMVISDRMGDSSVVYQGYGRGLDISLIKTINAWAMNSIQPAITFYLRIDLEQAEKRVKARNLPLTAFEKEKRTFTQKLVDGFDHLFKNEQHVILLNGTDSMESLTSQAVKHILLCINKQNKQ